MVDDQDGCEWVNVSSGTGSSGQFRTKGRKTVIVVILLLSLVITDLSAECTFTLTQTQHSLHGFDPLNSCYL